MKALERQNPNKASLAAPEINGVRGPRTCATATVICLSMTILRADLLACTWPLLQCNGRRRRWCPAGKWELIYTTSGSILGTSRPPFLRPIGPIYQFIGAHRRHRDRRAHGRCFGVCACLCWDPPNVSWKSKQD